LVARSIAHALGPAQFNAGLLGSDECLHRRHHIAARQEVRLEFIDLISIPAFLAVMRASTMSP
jgi:hypothetical protein